MITPSYSITATERVLPNLALDFTTASLDARVTFTRALNTATVVNSSGYVAGINANLPRFDYDPVALTCKGLLIEESRINLVTYSEDFRNTATAGSSRPWNYNGTSITVNAVTSPSNTATGNTITEDSGTSTHTIYNQITDVTSGAVYTFSVFAKKGSRDWIKLLEGNNVTGIAYFNLNTGVVGTVSGTGSPSATITNYGNGWYRCTLTLTLASTIHNCQIGLATGDNIYSYAGNGTGNAYLWGAQLELGAFSTSYIPNVATGTTTRNADNAEMTGTNFSSWYNASEGTFFGQALLGGSAQLPAIGTVRTPVAITDAIVYGFTGASQTTCQIWVGGVNQVDLGPARNYNAVNGVCLSYKANDVIVSNNGGATLSDNTSLIPTVSAFYIGQNRATTPSCIWIQKISFYPQRLTNNEVLAFSKV